MKLTSDDYANTVAAAATKCHREPTEQEIKIYQELKKRDIAEGTPITLKKDQKRGEWLLLHFIPPVEENIAFGFCQNPLAELRTSKEEEGEK